MDDDPSSFTRLTCMIIALTVGISFVMSFANRHAIMSEWKKHRCDVGTMMSAFLYKPADYAGSASQFASDNFYFCVGEYARRALQAAAAPAVDAMGKQVESGGVVTQLQNSIRNMLGELMRSFSGVLEDFYRRYNAGVVETSRITQRLRSAVQRLQGAVVASLYMGLTLYTTILNSVNFVIFVAIILLTIIAIIFILLIFIFFPFLPILLGTIGLITAAGFGALVAGPADVICFAPTTPILRPDGSVTEIQDLRLGDAIYGGGKVEGMFTLDGTRADMYELHGIQVSGGHLVRRNDGRFCTVADHPDARRIDATCPVLYCPIITNRRLFAAAAGVSMANTITEFCDWEEVDDDSEADHEYDKAVRKILSMDINDAAEPSLVSGVASGTYVITKNDGPVQIQRIKVGDSILDSKGTFTEVRAILQRIIHIEPASLSTITDGTIVYNKINKTWSYSIMRGMTAGTQPLICNQLITASGKYCILCGDESLIVRDATEVGLERIDSLTPLVLEHLNREI